MINKTRSLVPVKHGELLLAKESYAHSEIPPWCDFRVFVSLSNTLQEGNPCLMLIQSSAEGT